MRNYLFDGGVNGLVVPGQKVVPQRQTIPLAKAGTAGEIQRLRGAPEICFSVLAVVLEILRLLDDLHDRQVGVFIPKACCLELIDILLKPLRVKRGCAVASVIITAEPDVDVPRVRYRELQILFAGDFVYVDFDLGSCMRRHKNGEHEDR